MKNSSFNRLFIVSYRLPFTLQQTSNGLTLRQNSGGLVSAVLSLAERSGRSADDVASRIHWVGHGEPAFRHVEAGALENDSFQVHPVFLDEAVNKGFYEGFSNDLLWPLFHYFPSYASFREDDFDCYRQANEQFLATLLPLLEPGDLVWIHDFQLILLPDLLRQARPDLTSGYFFHIPFPTYEIVKLLPRTWRQALIQGVLGADLVGFHTADYVQHFLQSTAEVLDLPVIGQRVVLPDRSVAVGAFPISVDFTKFDSSSQEPSVLDTQRSYQTLLRNTKLIFSVDRLDYTKGILYRLQGYERFLQQNPDWCARVTLVMTVVPSRDQLGHYQELKREIDETVGRINGLFGNIGWRPIVYSYASLTFTELLALYTACDVALVTPIRDGMNLVCKEFVASRHDERGVLILSELAGAAQELPAALIINPTDTQEMAEAILQGLTMPADEQQHRMKLMRTHLQNHNVFRWSYNFLAALDDTLNQPNSLETNLPVASLLSAYSEASRRLLLFDFDGTLSPIVNNPGDACLTDSLKETLLALSQQADVAVISGRDRAFLAKTFASIPVWLVAEHGAFLKKPDQDWERLDLSDDDWVAPVRAIMQPYVGRFAGSFVEEKETSIAWHYRMADADEAEAQAVDLANELRQVTASVPLRVIQGSKVVEVKTALHSKGTVALALTEQHTYDFILSIGDDTTDEDMFQQLPVWACTLKVGPGTSAARYRLARQPEVATLLRQLSETFEPAA